MKKNSFKPFTQFVDLYTARDLPPERVEVAPYYHPASGITLWVTRDGRICRCYQNYRQGWKQGKYVTIKQWILKGYYLSYIRDANKYSYNVRTNRIVCTAWHGECPHPGWQADHINGNPMDNRPENMQWLSPQENLAKRPKKLNWYEYNISVHERGYAQPILTTSSPKAVDTFVGNTTFSNAAKHHCPGHFIFETHKYEIVVHKQLKRKAHD